LQIPSVGPVTMIEPDNLEPQSEALLSQRGRLDKDDSGGLRQIAGCPLSAHTSHAHPWTSNSADLKKVDQLPLAG
jgi:hypothetical protein